MEDVPRHVLAASPDSNDDVLTDDDRQSTAFSGPLGDPDGPSIVAFGLFSRTPMAMMSVAFVASAPGHRSRYRVYPGRGCFWCAPDRDGLARAGRARKPAAAVHLLLSIAAPDPGRRPM